MPLKYAGWAWKIVPWAICELKGNEIQKVDVIILNHSVNEEFRKSSLTCSSAGIHQDI